MNAMRSRQRGIALLVALLTVALAAILIASLLDRGELALARTRNALRGEQAAAYAQGLEAYAAEVLIKDDASIDSNSDPWAQPLPPQLVPGGSITASAIDRNGCFNLNNLMPSPDVAVWQKMFVRLLNARGVSAEIASAVADWLGASGDGDAADNYYLALPVPYRSARRAFAHVSELRLVRGVSGESYARIAPFLCALPPGTLINVNTASVPVLQTLADGITQAMAESLWQNGNAHWSKEAFQKQLSDLGILAPETSRMIGGASTYFLARCDVNLDSVLFTFYSLIERRDGANGGVRVIERSSGSDDALVAPALPAESTAPAP